MTGSMSATKIRVLLVDDNQRLTSAWERLFRRQKDIELVGTLERADGLTEAAKSLTPDVILIDLTMDGRDPLEAIAEVHKAHPTIRNLVYSAHTGAEWKKRAKEAGADAYLDKAEDPQDILDAIRGVAR